MSLKSSNVTNLHRNTFVFSHSKMWILSRTRTLMIKSRSQKMCETGRTFCTILGLGNTTAAGNTPVFDPKTKAAHSHVQQMNSIQMWSRSIHLLYSFGSFSDVNRSPFTGVFQFRAFFFVNKPREREVDTRWVSVAVCLPLAEYMSRVVVAYNCFIYTLHSPDLSVFSLLNIWDRRSRRTRMSLMRWRKFRKFSFRLSFLISLTCDLPCRILSFSLSRRLFLVSFKSDSSLCTSSLFLIGVARASAKEEWIMLFNSVFSLIPRTSASNVRKCKLTLKNIFRLSSTSFLLSSYSTPLHSLSQPPHSHSGRYCDN